MKRKPKPPAPPTAAELAAKLRALDALRKRVKAAAGPAAKPKAKRRPRFTGSWGCGPGPEC